MAVLSVLISGIIILLIGINETIGFLIPIVIILLFGARINLYFIAKSGALIIMMLILMINIKKYIHKTKIDYLLILDVLKYGAPLLLVSFGGSVFGTGDRVVVNMLLGKEMVAFYTVPSKLANAIQQMLIYPVSMVVFPQYVMLWEKKGKEATQKYLSKGLEIYSFLAIPIVFGTFILRRELIETLSNQNYEIVANYLPIAVSGLLIYGCYYFVVAGFFIEKKTLLLGKVMFFSAIVSIALDFIGGKLFGLGGVFISNSLSYIIFLVIGYRFSKNIVKVRINLNRIIQFIISSIIMTIIVIIIPQPANKIITIIMSIIEGGLVYLILNLKYIYSQYQSYCKE